MEPVALASWVADEDPDDLPVKLSDQCVLEARRMTRHTPELLDRRRAPPIRSQQRRVLVIAMRLVTSSELLRNST